MHQDELLYALRTDLAAERRRADPTSEGVAYEEERDGVITLTRVTVTSDEGAREIGKPRGRYLTLALPPLFAMEETDAERAVRRLADCLHELLPKENGRPLLVAGLGNRALTADAIGPLAADKTPATAHLRADGLCVVVPGVTGQSGTEASALVRGAAREVNARAVIAIDALCARSPERLVCTIQLSDTGLTPGSGIRAPRTALDEESVGVPVIALGVPTVVSSAALVCDALRRAGADEIPNAFSRLIEEDALYVSPKSIDEGIENGAALIGMALARLG